MNKSLFKVFSLITILALMLMALPMQSVQAISTTIVISQVYGGGGNAGAPYTNDFVELFNRGTTTVSLSGWSIQYASATGTGNFGSNTTQITPLSGTLAPGQYLLVQEAASSVGAPLPTPDVTDASPIAMAAGAGKVALINTTTPLGCNGSVGQPCSAGAFASIVDLVGYGNANFFEGSGAAPTLSNTTGALRLANGCTETDNNATDFVVAAPAPRNTASPLNPCTLPDSAPSISSTNPTGGATNVILTSNVDVTFSEPVNVSGNWFQLVCPSATYNVVDTVVTGGPNTFTIDPNSDLVNSETCTLTVFALQVEDQDANDPPGNMTADYITIFTAIGPDAAPTVASTVPADNATNVAVSSNITVNFSETVNVSGSWFTLSCAVSGSHAATVTGGPTSFVVNPSTDFSPGELCTFTVVAALVSDQDNNDPPNNISFDFIVDFTTFDACAQTFTPIYNIQGSGLAAAITGTVTTKGVVVGDFEYPGSGSTSAFLRGFYLQDLNGDGNPATSDSIFVFNGNNNSVSLGSVVSVTGTAAEFQDQTQISSSSITTCGTGTVTPVDVDFPVPSSTFLEQYEGMLVRLTDTMYVTEHFQLGRFGQVVLSADGKLKQPTNVVSPGAAAIALQAQNNLNKIILDDASQAQNPDPILFGRNGNPLSASNTLRGGDTATNIIGVMSYTWAGNAASGNAYRVRPINALTGYVNFVEVNSRPVSAPVVGGNVKVVGMNLLNYFNTFADGNAGTPGCFPGGGDSDCRGANSATEFSRQSQKTVAAILAMNPDVLGVNELENDGYGPASAIQTLVDQLNAATAAGTYAFIDVDAETGQTNAMGTDAIRVALLYKPGVVTPIGQTSPLNTVAFVNGGDPAPRSRPSLAQAFQLNSNDAVFIVDVNHLKSKGSACAAPDAGDGQGNCNQVRVNAATELMNWLATDPTGTGDPDILLVGDYNAYAMEDPITVIKNAGFTNLIESFLGPDAYSYVFDGQWGYLDHALGSATLISQVSGIGDYHINADEPSVLDYNVEFKSAGQVVSLFAPNQFRVSDHDSVVIGLQLNDPPTVEAGGPYSVNEGGSVSVTASGSDPNGDTLTYEWDLDNNGSFETSGQTATFSAALLDGPGSHTIKVRATDPGGLFAVSTATVNVLNVAPTVSASFASNSISCGPNNSTLNVSFTDPAAADTHTAVIDWGDGNTQNVSPATSPFSLQHTYALAGTYTATVTVTDDDGGVGTKTATVTVNFNTSGFLPPINTDGTSVFKYNSTIPVKISFTNCDGSTPANLAPTIKLTMLSGATPGLAINEPVSTSAADTTGVMRFSTNQYIYNLATKPLPDPSATYLITVTIPYNGQTVTVQFGLRP